MRSLALLFDASECLWATISSADRAWGLRANDNRESVDIDQATPHSGNQCLTGGRKSTNMQTASNV